VYAHRQEALSKRLSDTTGGLVGDGKTNFAVSTLWHEFGHDVDYHYGTGNATANRSKRPESFGYTYQELKDQGMSRYGLTNRNEFVAEYTTGYMQGVKFGPAVHDTYK